MGRRTCQETTTRTVTVCDLCGMRADSPHRCDICGRECGYCCASLKPCYDPDAGGMIDLCLRVCKECVAAGADVSGLPFLELIRAEVMRTDLVLAGLMVRWKEWVKESAARQSPPTRLDGGGRGA